MSHAELAQPIPESVRRVRPDTRPHLALVSPPKEAVMGESLFTAAFRKHRLSPTIMAADILLASYPDSQPADGGWKPNVQPTRLGGDFLRDSKLVQEVASQAGGRMNSDESEAKMRKTVSNVISIAESIIGATPEDLRFIIKQYNDVPDRSGVMFNETDVRRMALLAKAGKLEIPLQPEPPQPEIGRFGPQDETELDKPRRFNGSLIESEDGQERASDPEPPALPHREVTVYQAPLTSKVLVNA